MAAEKSRVAAPSLRDGLLIVKVEEDSPGGQESDLPADCQDTILSSHHILAVRSKCS